jgi:putative endonuclease
MYIVYVLFSQKHNKIYIGYTSDLNNRLLSHNELATKGYTIKYRPWTIVYTEDFESKTTAIKREKQLKGAKGREFIWNLIKITDSSDS